MAKLTLDEKLHRRKIRKPSFLYGILGGVWKLLFMKKYNVHLTFQTDFRKEKGPYILISNHASRLDYIYAGLPLLPNRFNFVAGYNEFFRSHLAPVFRIVQAIPKKNFTPDLYTVREASRIIKEKGKLLLFPEGMSSISGANQPVAIGTGKFLKHFKIPVYFAVIKGGYLTSTKYCLDERPGYVEVVYDRLFTPDDLAVMSAEDIETGVNTAIYHDDYAWNLVEKHRYATRGEAAKNLSDLLYRCPKCGAEFMMKAEKDTILCTNCGNGATIDETYAMRPLDSACVIPRTQTEWLKMERERVRQEVQDENFELKEEVELGMLPAYRTLKHQKTSEIVGSGVLTLNRSGLGYEGTRNGEPYRFHIDSLDLPTYGMCTDMSRFYTFNRDGFVEFYPKRRVVEKWFLATEELHRLNGGKWRDFSPADPK